MRGSGARTAGLVVVGLVLFGGIGTADARTLAAEDAFWESVRVTGDEVDRYGSLTDMADRSDAVVLGHFGDVVGTRDVGGTAPQGVTYAQVELVVDEVVRGRDPGPSVTVEGMTPISSEADLPDGQMLVLLHEKRGSGESGLWRPLNSRGLWTTTERAQIDTPLDEDVPANDPLYADLVDRVDTIAGLAAEL